MKYLVDSHGNNVSATISRSIPVAIGATENLIQNYSVTSGSAQYAPGASIVAELTQLEMIMVWTQGAGTAINMALFANLAALTNGISINIIRAGYESDVQTIKLNGQLPNITVQNMNNTLILQAKWNLDGTILYGTDGDYLEVFLNDNFTSLGTLRFNVQANTGLAV